VPLDGGDPARRHARKGSPSPETRTRLDRWHAVLIAELDDVMAELRPPVPVDGMPWAEGDRPGLATRARLIDLGVRIAHELGAEIDDTTTRGAFIPDAPARPRPRSRVDFGGT
jgi:hypothetical protein